MGRRVHRSARADKTISIAEERERRDYELRALLDNVGVRLPVERIATWIRAQRREAARYARAIALAEAAGLGFASHLCEASLAMGEPLRVFISYSRKDAKLKDKLLEQLKVLERFHNLEVWTDDQIVPGAKWCDEIDKALREADVALLLVSASFLASKFINDVEIPKLLKRNAAAGFAVIPVILSDCLWQHHPALEPFQVLPKDAKPIAKHSNKAKAWKQVAEAIAALAKNRPAPLPAPGKASRAGTWAQAPRGRLLRRRPAMAVRAPEGVEAERKEDIPNDDPVLLSMLNAPLDDEPLRDDERAALEEWLAGGEGVDGEVVTAMIVERAAREG